MSRNGLATLSATPGVCDPTKWTSSPRGLFQRGYSAPTPRDNAAIQSRDERCISMRPTAKSIRKKRRLCRGSRTARTYVEHVTARCRCWSGLVHTIDCIDRSSQSPFGQRGPGATSTIGGRVQGAIKNPRSTTDRPTDQPSRAERSPTISSLSHDLDATHPGLLILLHDRSSTWEDNHWISKLTRTGQLGQASSVATISTLR